MYLSQIINRPSRLFTFSSKQFVLAIVVALFSFFPYVQNIVEYGSFGFFETKTAHAAVLNYTPTDSGISYLGGTSLSRINDGNIATNGVNSYQVHPTNALGKTITMTFDSPVIIEDVDFYNRTSCCQNRIDGAQMIFKDSAGATLYTYTFAATPNFVNFSDPAGNISGVKTVELTNFQGNSQNFREIVFNGETKPGGVDAGLTLWLDADDASTLYQETACTNLATAGEGVGCWHDKSGQDNHVTGTAEPTVTAAGLNGKTVLDFAVDSLQTVDGAPITSNSSYTKFAVVKFDAGGSNNIISSGGGGGQHAFWGNGGTQIAMWHGSTFINSGNLGTANYQIGVGRYGAPDTVPNVINVNGAQSATNNTTRAFNSTTSVRIGSHGSNNLNGQLAEAIIYDRALTDAEIDAVECYLADKWDINVVHCNPAPSTGPGGVVTGLTAWLKADSGITGNPITAWDNAEGTVASPVVVGTPDLEAESINFNPAVSFQGVSTVEYLNFGNIVNGWNSAQAFMVAAQQNEDVRNANETGHWRIGGNSNSHVTWVNELIYESFGNSSRINALATPYSTHIPHIYSASQSSTNQANLYWNGENIHSSVRGSLFGNQPVWLARNRGGGRYLGDIPEFVLYDAPLSSIEQQRVDSYLALKYGLTLDQGTPTDYLASDGTTKMWDKDAATASTYNHNITGIGRDDGSVLGQVKSRSSHAESLVIIEAEGEGTNSTNAFTDIDDLEFLMWAHDNETLSLSGEKPGPVSPRFTREWTVQTNGNVGTVKVAFDLGNQVLMETTVAGDYALLIDTDGDFSDATIYTTGASLTGDEISFTGVTLNDGDFFTLSGPAQPAPGGVASAIWLRADAGTDTTTNGDPVTKWLDQLGSNNAISTGTARPTYENASADQVNFNPTLRFDGSNDYLGITRNFPETNFTQLIVYKTIDANGNLSTIVSPTSPTAGANDRNFRVLGGGLSHRLWNANQTITSTADFNNNLAHIGSITVENGVGQTLHSDGDQVGFGTRGFSNFNWQTGMVIGNHRGNALNGDIAEVIFVDSALDTTDRQKVESYLAIKYGITLDQATSTNYISSDSAVVFDAAVAMVGYQHDIAGIALDENGGLDQSQSQSQNADALVTVFGASSLEDGDFLLWANNDGPLTQATTNLPVGPVSRLDRTWRVEETNDVGTVSVSVDISGLGITSNAAAKLGLIIDSDTDFTSGATVEAGDALVDGVVTFNNVSFTDGDYFTLGIIPVNIGDRIWSDLNGDGIDGGGVEIGVDAITIELYSDDGATPGGSFDGDESLIATTTTVDGNYDFTGLDAGDYWVAISDTDGWLTGAPQTGGVAAPQLISAPAGADINTADYGYQFTPPVVTDGNISVNSGSGTNDTFIIGDTLVVTWDASVNGDVQPHPLRSVLADMSSLGGGAATVMTDTAACGGTAGDDIYETCITYSAGTFDVSDVNPTITVSNAGATTGPVSDTTDTDVDNEQPVFVASGLSISTDNGVVGVAAVNGNGISADTVVVDAVLDQADGDSITWDATSIGGSATRGNNSPVTITPGTLEELSVVFDVTATDNAGNSVTLDTDSIDNASVGVDNDVPAGLTVTNPIDGSLVTGGPMVTGACETDAIVTIASSNITPASVSTTCVSGGYAIPVTMSPSSGEVTLTITQADTSGNYGGSTSVTFEIDSDGDGVNDSIEDAGANGGDGNGDGILDSQQQDISGAPNPVTGEYTTLQAAGACTFITENAFVAESGLSAQDPTAEYPVGLVDFQVNCPAAGDSADITIFYTQNYDTSNWVYKKYNSVTGDVYSDITGLVTFGDHTYMIGTASGTTVTTVSFTVTDGDPQTDEDTGPANGLINDPSGPAILASSGSGGSTTYACRDETATNYKTFGKSRPSMCLYEDSTEQEIDNILKEEERTEVEEKKEETPLENIIIDTNSVCSPLLTETIALNRNNDEDEVTKLQNFLNNHEGESLKADGIYNQDDFEAVKRFQSKYSSSVLEVWGLTEPTGYVYLTTRMKINSFNCNKTLECPIFTQYNSRTENTNTEKVFMAELGFYNGVINTTWDDGIYQSIISFQETFKATMLTPWGLTKGTGYKYKTTNKFMNEMVGCTTEDLQLENGVTVSY